MKYLNEFSYIVLAIVLSVFANYFIFTTEGEVWRKTAIQSIQKIGELERTQKQYQDKVTDLLKDLNSIRSISEVDSIMKKHGI